jgi:uncharacterized protein (DUF433 family)
MKRRPAIMPQTQTRRNGAVRRRRPAKRVELGNYVVSDPEVYHGELTFKGTRIPVKTVLTFLGMGESVEELLKGYPSLSREAIEESVRLAKEALVAPFEPRNGRKE